MKATRITRTGKDLGQASQHLFGANLEWISDVPQAISSERLRNPTFLGPANVQSGLVVCLSGRPGFFLLFSADEGKTWSPPHWLSESPGPWHQSASGYGKLIELEPGVMGVAYDDYEGEGDAARMVTKFRRYRVEMKTEGV